MDHRPPTTPALGQRIRALLQEENQRLQREIRAYPTPVPRCDEQFNHLIERREHLFRESAQLDNAAESGLAQRAEWLRGFIDSSRCLEEAAKRQLKAELSEATLGGEPSAIGEGATADKPWRA
jgi:hypothetical protein